MTVTVADLIARGLVVLPAKDGAKHPGLPVTAPGITEAPEAGDRFCVVVGSKKVGLRSGVIDVELDTTWKGLSEEERQSVPFRCLGEEALAEAGIVLPPGPTMVTSSGSVHHLLAVPELPEGKTLRIGSGLLPKVDVPWQFLALDGDKRTWSDWDKPVPPAPEGLLELLHMDAWRPSDSDVPLRPDGTPRTLVGAPPDFDYWTPNEWCPASSDHHSPGLTLGALPDGRWQPECRGGCARDDVIAALVARGDYTRDELYPPDNMAVQPWDVRDDVEPDAAPATKRGRFRRAADIVEEPVTWLWDGRIPFGKVTLLGGDPEGGKTFLMLDLTARITRGDQLPGDSEDREPADVVFVSYEDGAGDTLLPRARRMGADLTRLHFVTGDDLTLDDNSLLTSEHITTIEEEIVALGTVKLLVVDPLGSFVGGATDTGLDNKVRAALAATVALAERLNIAVVVLAHMNKSAGKAIYRINGSIGFVGLVRSVLVAGEHDGHRGLAVGKNNLAERAATLEYSIVDMDGPGTRSGVVQWGREMVGVNADMLVSTAKDERTPRATPAESKNMAARAWLSERLNGKGWVPAAVLEAEVSNQDFSWRTVQDAGKAIGAEIRRTSTMPSVSEWSWTGSELVALLGNRDVA